MIGPWIFPVAPAKCMGATEVTNRYEELLRETGPLTATMLLEMNRLYWENFDARIKANRDRINSHYLQPLVDRVFRICLRADGKSYRKFMFDQGVRYGHR